MSQSFGVTCAARGKKRRERVMMTTSSLIGLLLLLTTFGPQPGLPMSAAAAANSTASGGLSLGFGPTSLTPVSSGVPVYTTGETIWVGSDYNYSITLTLTSASAASNAAPAAELKLEPQAIAPIYTFVPGDTDGVWRITTQGPFGQTETPVHFVNLANHRPVSLGPLQYSLDGGRLSISAQTSLGNSYDQELCATGSLPSRLLTFDLPSDMHDLGSISLSPGEPLGLAVLGVLNASISFWFELYHPYALDSTGGNGLSVDNVLAARSQPVDIVTNGPMSTTLTWNAPLRPGRYDLRGYYENTTNIEVFQSRILILNDSSWISLSSTCLPQTLQSSSRISYSANLTSGQASWPRRLYLMYRTFGVEAVDSYPVRANVSSLNFVASPWGRPLSDASVNVSSSAGILQTGQEGGSLFVMASKYPIQLNYSLAVGGATEIARGSVTIPARYSSQNVEVNSSELNVHVLSDQGSPITLEVKGAKGLGITRPGLVGTNQTVSFFLPAGSYTVVGSQAGSTESAQAGLTNGRAATVTLNFNTLQSLEIILIVAALVGVLANVLVWAVRSRSSTSSRIVRTTKMAP